MMNRWVQISSMIGVTAVGSFMYVVAASPPNQYMHWLNATFIIALIYMVCSAGTVLIFSPPFQRLTYNFSYFFSKLKRENKIADELERKDRSYKGDDLAEKERPRWTLSLLISGILLAMVSMILSIAST